MVVVVVVVVAAAAAVVVVAAFREETPRIYFKFLKCLKTMVARESRIILVIISVLTLFFVLATFHALWNDHDLTRPYLNGWLIR